MSFLYVALGGALGSIGRYAISLLPAKTSFPILTLATNLLGAVAIGFASGMAEAKNMPSNFLSFFKTGICGGFTTFSTFSLESYDLFNAQKYFLGIIYIGLSVVSCFAGIWCGKKIASPLAR